MFVEDLVGKGLLSTEPGSGSACSSVFRQPRTGGPGRHRRIVERSVKSILQPATGRPALAGPIIDARDLTFQYAGQSANAVHGVSFAVEQREIIGFLGPNGAGKTTTMRLLTTQLAPTAGDAWIAGSSLRNDPHRIRHTIGYVPQTGGIHWDFRVTDELFLQARLHGLSPARARSAARQICAQLDLAGLENRFAKTLSGGQRRRLEIALGLVHRPAILFLDEPSTGLDPDSRENVWNLVRRLRDRDGTTIFLTTHYLDEADALCDRIIVMDQGTIVDGGTPHELKQRIAADLVTIDLNGYPEDACQALVGCPGIRNISIDGLSVRLIVNDGDKAIPGLVRALDSADVGIAAIRLTQPTLDDVFRSITRRSVKRTVGPSIQPSARGAWSLVDVATDSSGCEPLAGQSDLTRMGPDEGLTRHTRDSTRTTFDDIQESHLGRRQHRSAYS